MPRHAVPAAGWNQTNMVPSTRGLVKSRRSMFEVATSYALWPINCAFSYRPQSDDIMRYYQVGADANGDTYIDGADEDDSSFPDVFHKITQGACPEIVTWAVVDNIIFCASPSFATHYAYMNGSMFEAKKEDSIDELLLTYEIPRGLCVEWAGRLVIAADDVLYIADALHPFTFTIANVQDPPGGSIRGLHSVNGNLVICTTNGVYALPMEAALGPDVLGSWQPVSTYACLNYGHTAVHDGVVWGVSENGLSSIFPAGGEVDVNQDEGMRWYGLRFNDSNWRKGSYLIPLLDGVALVSPKRKGMFVLSPKARHGSWWEASGDDKMAVKGARLNGDGDQIFYADSSTSTSKQWQLVGNRTDDEANVYASLSGATSEHTVDADPVMRQVQAAAAIGGEGEIFLSVSGKSVKTNAPPACGVIAGTSEWGDGTALQNLETKSRRITLARRSDHHEIEVGVNRADTVMRTDLSIDFHGVGPKRSGS